MTTDRKREANRRNAQRSTGPRTAAGKARAKQNAWRHGLSVPASLEPYDGVIRDLETDLRAESVGAPLSDEDARALATAEVEVLRARAFRRLMMDELSDRCSGQSGSGTRSSSEDVLKLLQIMIRADRYERRALSRRKGAIRGVGVSRAVNSCDAVTAARVARPALAAT